MANKTITSYNRDYHGTFICAWITSVRSDQELTVMRTPAGSECRYYFQDFHRGKNVQECRLVKGNPASKRWRPTDCAACPVPAILQANASPNLELSLVISSRLLGMGRKLTVTARCRRHNIIIEDPFVGCQMCNHERPGLDLFLNALEDGTSGKTATE